MTLPKEQAKEIARKLDEGTDEFFALNTRNKIDVVVEYLDLNIGDEPKAEIKSIKIPGVPFEISGAALEKGTDMIFRAIATLVINKWFPTPKESESTGG